MTNCRIGRVTIKRPDNLYYLPGVTMEPITPARILTAALEANYVNVIVVAFDHTGNISVAGSEAEVAEAILMLELGKKTLLDMAEHSIVGHVS